ncbi:WD40 repeat domain-containing protein [Sporobolomyces koalae]|uniref:WD40 repeat domain-containing protein n=1 Tax=Sporobolomyces koalae TaxID=500713 RepID=UPI00317CDAC9
MSGPPDVQLPSFVDSISSLAFHPTDPDLLLVASWDQHVYLTNLQNPSALRKLAVRGAILDVCWAPDSATVAYVAGLGNEVRSVDFETQESQLITKHDQPVKCVEYCPQLNAVVSASWDSTLKVTRIDPTTRNPSPSPLVLPLPDKAYSLSISPSKLVVAMGQRHVYIYDLETIKTALEQNTNGADVSVWSKRESNLKFMTRALACMPDDTGYAMTSIEGRVAVEFFDPEPAKQAKKYAFKCHRQVIDGVDTVYPVQGLAFNPIHGTFSTGGGDATVSLWDPFAKKRLRQFPKYPAPISDLAFSCDGNRLAIAFSIEDEGGNNVAPGQTAGGNGVWIRECGDEVKPKAK